MKINLMELMSKRVKLNVGKRTVKGNIKAYIYDLILSFGEKATGVTLTYDKRDQYTRNKEKKDKK